MENEQRIIETLARIDERTAILCPMVNELKKRQDIDHDNTVKNTASIKALFWFLGTSGILGLVAASFKILF